MSAPVDPTYVDLVLQVAGRDASIARVLQEICGLDPAVRTSALEVLGAYLRTQSVPEDVLACVAALRRDDVARRIVEVLGPSR